jgi:mannose-6-phosphate isomerase-like protein (cupin superfamily)
MLALLLAATASAANGPGVEIWPSSNLKSAGPALESQARAEGIAGKTFGAATVWRRAKSGEAELHRLRTDLLVIEDGSATLVFGGTIPDAHATAPNEVRGASIRGGESRKLGQGDIIRIPAGTPHQFVLAAGESVSYFSLKLAR